MCWNSSILGSSLPASIGSPSWATAPSWKPMCSEPFQEKNIVRLAPAVMKKVHTTYNDIALHGKGGTEPEVAYLQSVAEQAVRDGAHAILLAGTDLSSFYAEQPPTYPSVDVARLHIDQIIRRATHQVRQLSRQRP